MNDYYELLYCSGAYGLLTFKKKLFFLVQFLGILIYDWTLLSKCVLEFQGKWVNFKNWVGSRKSVLNKKIIAHNSDSRLKEIFK